MVTSNPRDSGGEICGGGGWRVAGKCGVGDFSRYHMRIVRARFHSPARDRGLAVGSGNNGFVAPAGCGLRQAYELSRLTHSIVVALLLISSSLIRFGRPERAPDEARCASTDVGKTSQSAMIRSIRTLKP